MTGRAALLGGVAAAAAVATLAVTLAAGRGGPGGVASAAPPPAAAARPAPGAATVREIARLEARLRRSPRDARSLALLGIAYEQRMRETGDPSWLARAGAALRRAHRIDPREQLAVTGLGSLALSRHRFGEALALGRRAVALAPGAARNRGVVGDALLELGRYRAAFAAFDRMAALEPSVASYARVAYARELLGRPRAAIAAMTLAAEAAGGQPEAEAWTRVELAKLFFGLGDLRAADAGYRAALAAFPGFPAALDGRARVEAARGRYAAAELLARRAVERMPLPAYVTTLADVQRTAGKRAEARRQDALVGAISRLLAANGVRTDLEVALYDVDHGIRLPRALALARRARAARPGIEGDDVLGWALTRNGRCAEGLVHARRALRLGTRDALKLFHLGMAQRCAGRPAEARRTLRRALALNPHFSLLWSPVAREAIR